MVDDSFLYYHRLGFAVLGIISRAGCLQGPARVDKLSSRHTDARGINRETARSNCRQFQSWAIFKACSLAAAEPVASHSALTGSESVLPQGSETITAGQEEATIELLDVEGMCVVCDQDFEDTLSYPPPNRHDTHSCFEVPLEPSSKSQRVARF